MFYLFQNLNPFRLWRPLQRKGSDLESTALTALLTPTAINTEKPQPFTSPESKEKGRCWCCWETTDTPSNTLIRVCLGCKDPDLQWIHQTCVDSFITALPDAIDPSTNAVMEKRVFKCTRCAEIYNVKETETSRVYVIATDKNLRGVFLIMTLCMSIINYCSISILVENWGTGRIVIDGGFVKVNSSLFCGIVLGISWWFALETMWLLWHHAGGRMIRKVEAVAVEE
ncbi:hypothetical protein BCR33DRAFT_721290 [Rhizoclosmatium globosum]|uniref:RING-CH-type domain-containing protein n=1 Tax=Rhizoclosmatium globosum TaxID=329046 RepID=A0A1Y2BSS1_9FUNG|nr:hypothetical protein BCR33DRAFT_721290 [Rhizoclosmatium globosum]|eukprot:ORY37799.1 hypothetical protein BCR33DRAFT_721290 [Rhizoclosmatium globosum]